MLFGREHSVSVYLSGIGANDSNRQKIRAARLALPYFIKHARALRARPETAFLMKSYFLAQSTSLRDAKYQRAGKSFSKDAPLDFEYFRVVPVAALE